MAISFRTGCLLPVSLSRCFWKLLSGSLDLEDIKTMDIGFYNRIQFFKNANENEINSLAQNFTVTLACGNDHVLKDNGKDLLVTIDNREEYIKLAIQARNEEYSDYIKEVQTGFFSVVPNEILDICNWEDVKLRVCGTPFIDLDLLKVLCIKHH